MEGEGLPGEMTPVLETSEAPGDPSTPAAPATGHLHHVHQITEAHGLINGQVAIAMQDSVVDDVSAETDTQDVVSGVTSRFPHEKQPVLGWLQLLHSFLA